MLYENDWREQLATHEAIPGEELFEIAPVRSESEPRCSRCGRELPILAVRYIDEWRAGEEMTKW